MYKLLKCIQEYVKICNVQYEISIASDKSKDSFLLQFTAKEFLHLSGISKINYDPIVDKYKHKSEKFIKYFTNNTNNPVVINEGRELLNRSSNTQINEMPNTNKNFYVSDRIEELTKLFLYFSKGDYNKNNKTHNVRIYSWKRDLHRNNRPYNSQISADFMITFDRIDPNSNATGENVCFFIKKETDGKCVPVSIFPTDISFSNDGKNSEPQYEFTSVKEITPSKTTVLFTCSKQRMEEIDDIINLHHLENELNELKQRRKSYAKTPKPASEKKYRNKLSFVLDMVKKPEYKTQMIIQAIKSLIAQRDDPNNQPYRKYIEDELPQLKQAAEQRGIDTSMYFAQINPNGTITKQVSLLSVIANVLNDIRDSVKSLFMPTNTPKKKKEKSKNFCCTAKKEIGKIQNAEIIYARQEKNLICPTTEAYTKQAEVCTPTAGETHSRTERTSISSLTQKN